MANTAHLVRRQSSRDLKPQKSVDRLEMKEMRGRLVAETRKTAAAAASYGATNAGFDDSSPNTKVGDFIQFLDDISDGGASSPQLFARGYFQS